MRISASVLLSLGEVRNTQGTRSLQIEASLRHGGTHSRLAGRSLLDQDDSVGLCGTAGAEFQCCGRGPVQESGAAAQPGAC